MVGMFGGLPVHGVYVQRGLSHDVREPLANIL